MVVKFFIYLIGGDYLYKIDVNDYFLFIIDCDILVWINVIVYF